MTTSMRSFVPLILFLPVAGLWAVIAEEVPHAAAPRPSPPARIAAEPPAPVPAPSPAPAPPAAPPAATAPAAPDFNLPEVPKKTEPVPGDLLAPKPPVDPDQPVIDLSEEALESYVTFFPARSTRIGVGTYDMRLGDYRKASIAGFLGSNKGYLTRLEAIPTAGLTDKGRVEREALRVHFRDMIRLLESTNAPVRDPNFYVDESVGAIQVLIDYDTSGAMTRAEHIIARMSIFPTFFTIAKQNLDACSKPQLRRAITRLRASRSLFTDTVMTALLKSGHPQASETGGQVAAGAWKDVSAFADWLETEQMPKARKTDPLGEGGWREWLRAREDTELGADAILDAAGADLAKLQAEARDTARSISKAKPLADQIADLSADRLVPNAAQDAAEVEIGALWNWLQKNPMIALVTDDPIFVRETPGLRRRDAPIRAMLPGGYSKSKDAYLEVSPPDPDWPPLILTSWLAAYGKGYLPLAAAREAYPGRYLAWQKMRTSSIRTCKAIEFPSFAEGWPVYSEEAVVRAGFRSDDPRLKLAMLVDLVRADARLIASARMHAAGMSPNDAAAWLAAQGWWSRDEAAVEAERAFVDPDAGAAALGRLALRKLVADLQKGKGKDMTSRELYDRILGFGSAPVSALRRVLLPGDTGPLIGKSR